MMRIVFFGPFAGEFGWELLWWQGWVNRVSRKYFASYRKIASSYPGREPFYPAVDEFWPHPPEVANLNISKRNYFADYWYGSQPCGTKLVTYKKYGIIPSRREVLLNSKGADVSAVFDNLLDEYKRKLPEDTVYFVPFRKNYFEPDNLTFGIDCINGDEAPHFEVYKIGFEHQSLDYILPTDRGVKACMSICGGEKRLITIFPRARVIRRADKNWEESKYRELIIRFQEVYPQYKIAILGEPGGSFFADKIPPDCIDLVNVDSTVRTDAQVAALQDSVLSIGSMSGAILFALACGSKSLTWGYKEDLPRYHYENFMRTPLVFFPYINPTVKEVFDLAKAFIEKKIPPNPYYNWDPTNFFLPKRRISRFLRLVYYSYRSR